MSCAGEQDQDSQEGEWVALRLDQFPLLLKVSLSDEGHIDERNVHSVSALIHGAGFRSGIGYAGDEPLAAGVHQIE